MPVGFACTPTTADLMGFFYAMNNTGQICRSKKNAQSRYTMIDNAILQSWELTPEEKSILIYLLSMPENWIVVKRKLIEDSNIGRDRFNRAWKGLQEKGYVQSIRVIDSKTNQIKGWNHIVYEQPILPETNEIEDNPRVTEIPSVGNSESRESRKSENQSVYKEVNKQSNNLTKETINTIEIFENLWDLYGKKVAKDVAFKSFKKINPSLYSVIKKNIPFFVAEHRDIKYRPNFATYLNGKRWEDHLIAEVPQPFQLRNIATLDDD